MKHLVDRMLLTCSIFIILNCHVCFNVKQSDISFASAVFASNVSDYQIFGRDIILPNYSTIPNKGQSIVEQTTGTPITRMTDIHDATIDQPGLLVVYSRYTPLNTTGEYLLVHGEDSTSSWVYRVNDYAVIDKLRSDGTQPIGELNEIRWDYSGLHPTRVYFVADMKLYAMDILNQDKTRSIIHDFSIEFPEGVQILNDVEGDSSGDSRYWAFMVRAPYDGQEFPILYIITYDTASDKIIGVLKPSDVGKTKYLPRPNMVEISPKGTRVITHYGRCWEENRPEDIGTSLDGPHSWTLNFINPVKIAADETHSGWSFDTAGNEMFVSQNNQTDFTEARNIYTGETISIIAHEDMGWGNGFHYGKFYSASKPGWIFISTYADINDEWANNQLFMVELKPVSDNPRVLRITPSYNKYNGDYRDEGTAALSFDGTQIFWTANWGNKLENGQREVFRTQVPLGPVLSVTPRNQSIHKDSGTTTFSVSNTGIGAMTWTTTITSGNDWLLVTSGAEGTNTGTIACAYSTNTNKTSRTGTIRVTAPGAAGSPTDVTITQSANTTACTATIDGNLSLHIPVLSHLVPWSGAPSYSVNLAYEYNAAYPTLIPFKLTQATLAQSEVYSCDPSTLSDDFTIHIPDVLLPDGVTRIWLYLLYSTAISTNGSVCFYVLNYGVVSH